VFDLGVGGFHFDQLIREHFCQEFQRNYKINPKSNPRAWLRLLDESEKLKKQMSANNTSIPLAIECFMDDVDVAGKMNRYVF
jgi:molecular chaperone DnaK (HSP70)